MCFPALSSLPVLREVSPATARRRPDGSARFDGRAKARSVDDDGLSYQFVHEAVSAPERIAQFPEVSFGGADSLAPQKITKDLSKNHQLPCHFVNQRSLMKANLRVSAQTPCGLYQFGIGRQLV